MTAADLTRGLAQIGFVILGLIVLRRMLRNRSTTNLNAAGFFGAILALVLVERSIEVFGDAATPPEWAERLETALILVLPLALLRLADDFLVLPKRLLPILSAAAVISVTIALVLPEPGVAVLFLLAYFLATATYASARFFRASMSARGLTQRRLQAVSAGTGCLMLLVLIAIPAAIFAESPDLWAGLASVAALGSGIAYFAGFAPPRALKDAWQAPEVRQLLRHTTLVRSLANQDTSDFISDMENDLLRALGAREVVVWLWDEGSGQLIPPTHPQGRPCSVRAGARDRGVPGPARCHQRLGCSRCPGATGAPPRDTDLARR